LEEFEDEIEQNKDMRKNFNLYKNTEGLRAKESKKKAKEMVRLDEIKENTQEDEANIKDDDWETDDEDEMEVNPEMVQLEELMADMKLDEKTDEDNDRAIDDLLREMENVKVK